MSDQPEKQKEITPDENLKQEESAPDTASAEPSAPQGKEQQGDDMMQEERGDLSSELDGILDDNDEFQEIDLFDEGLLDEIDQDTDSPDTTASDTSAADASDDNPMESAADQHADSDQAADASADDAAPDSDAGDDFAQEIAADIAADLGQVDGQVSDEGSAGDASNVEQPASVHPSDDSEAAGPDKDATGTGAQADGLDVDADAPVREDAGHDSSVKAQEDQPVSNGKSRHIPEQEPDIELEPMEIGTSDAGTAAQEHALESAASPEGQQDPSKSMGNDRDAFGDDLGISLSDDELWDDSGEDDIPLFDDEPDVSEPHGPGAHVATAEQDASEGQAGGASVEGAAGQGLSADQDDSKGGESTQAKEDETELEDLIVIGGIGPAWLPYFISGVASIVLLGGIFVLWGMLSSPVVTVAATDTQAVSTTPPSVKQRRAQTGSLEKEPISRTQPKSEVTAVGDVPPIEGRQEVETFDLAPFIIPVMRQGELVFFKLTVELVVPDMRTKQELKKREAWVRDAIYTELKGIDVGPGTKGEFLLNYRRPLKKRIEKELAPLEIRDVRLMGYVLK